MQLPMHFPRYEYVVMEMRLGIPEGPFPDNWEPISWYGVTNSTYAKHYVVLRREVPE